MIHLLLLYRVIFYTFGFTILGFTIYKYIKTKNPIIGSFLFLWSAMTATAAAYVMNYYMHINLNIDRSFIGIKIQSLAICLIGVALPYFVHKIFNIINKAILNITVILAIIISISILIPGNEGRNFLFSNRVMLFITLSNIYSYILSLKTILSFKSKKDRKLGLLFMLTFLVLFSLLLVIDIMGLYSIHNNGFLFFPVFYMWIGGFFVFISITRKKFSITKSNNFKQKFITEYKLTKREYEIALLLADGLTYKKIAEKLFISLGTVSSHVMHIYDKTKTSSKIQLNKEISNFK